MKGFENFKNKKVYKVMLFEMQKYVYSESVFNTLYTEINHKYLKISIGQNKWYKKCPLFSFANSNSS